MVYKFFEKKASNTGVTKFAGGAIKNKIMPNHELAEELQKPIFKKFKKHLLKTIYGALILRICS